MTDQYKIYQPVLVPHARYRWDKLREQHQIVFPEGLLVLNETGAAIARLCDGRPTDEVIAALEEDFTGGNPADDVMEFIERLAKKGLLRDARDA